MISPGCFASWNKCSNTDRRGEVQNRVGKNQAIVCRTPSCTLSLCQCASRHGGWLTSELYLTDSSWGRVFDPRNARFRGIFAFFGSGFDVRNGRTRKKRIRLAGAVPVSELPVGRPPVCRGLLLFCRSGGRGPPVESSISARVGRDCHLGAERDLDPAVVAGGPSFFVQLAKVAVEAEQRGRRTDDNPSVRQGAV